ncbi:MAG TPA: type II secretion system protein, partial [Pyrinomonadaceae bacterium]
MTARRRQDCAGARERGYALVALLAMMTILALAVTAAAPVVRQQTQRERELEAIRRGEEVSEAIRQYVR